MNANAHRRGPPAPSRQGPAIDADWPIAGHYSWRIRSGAPASCIRIFWGQSLDPEGEEMTERSRCWQCELNGGRIDLFRIWPSCAGDPISRLEYERILARNSTMDEASPFYDPSRPIDLGSAPPPF